MKGTLSAIFTEARNPDLYAGPKLIPMEPTTGLEPGDLPITNRFRLA
jgi:hypothetical protein